jgi:hypothetical protein
MSYQPGKMFCKMIVKKRKEIAKKTEEAIASSAS